MSAQKKASAAQPLELAIVVEGKIIESNFDQFKEEALERIESLNLDLQTDADFDQAKLDVKRLRVFEDALDASTDATLQKLSDVYALLEGVRELKGSSSKARLILNREVTEKMLKVKENLVRDGIAALELRNYEFADMITQSIKGKSSIVKMQEAITGVVQNLNARTAANRMLFDAAREKHGESVAYGENTFLVMAEDAAKVEMERRIERHHTALKEAAQKAEIGRLRKEAEEKAKAEPNPESSHSPAPVPPKALQMPFPDESPAIFAKEPAPEDEMEAFQKTFLSCMAPVKSARQLLKDPGNIARAEGFATKLSEAWNAFKGGAA